MKINPVRAELLNADGHTEDFAHVPKNCSLNCVCCSILTFYAV
jgi:hypothetical protein